MKFSQEDDISIIKMEEPLTGSLKTELSDIFDYVGGRDAHKIILDFSLMPYSNSSGLNELFQSFTPLYERGFILEIQKAKRDVAELLRLANFHLIAKINSKAHKKKIDTASLSQNTNQ